MGTMSDQGRTWNEWVGLLVVLAIGIAGVFGWQLATSRIDFAAHFVAGFGGTMMLTCPVF